MEYISFKLQIKLNISKQKPFIISTEMNQDVQFSQQKIIECLAVIDIDPSLTHLKPTQQKWISSIQLFSDIPKDVKSGSKVLNISVGLHLVINYCQKNRLPIYEIDFITRPGVEWIPIKMPHSFTDKFVDSFLCYKTQQIELAEPLGDIDVINTERKSLFGHDKQVVNVPNGYKVVNNPIFQSYLIYKRIKSRLQQTFKPTILQFYPLKSSINLGLIPSFCFPEGIKLSRQLKGFITFTFVLTQSTGQRQYVTYLTFKQVLNQTLKSKLNVKTIQKIYHDKAFCIISKHKYSDQFSQCLQHLYRLSISKNDQPFHKVAQNFVNELKLPKQISTHGFSYSYNGCNVLFGYDKVLETTSDKSIYCIFKFMPLKQILTVFKAMLYERQVVFISQSKTVLGYALEAFLSLLFPFRWENVIIPIVPVTMKQYLTAPVPYLAGVTTFQLLDPSIQTQAVIILLDSGKILNDEDMPPLPQKLHKQLIKRLQQFQIYDPEQVRQYLQNPQNTYMFKMMQIQHPQFRVAFIQEAFLQFFLTLMKNYKKYWKGKFIKDVKETFSSNYSEPGLISEMFKVQEFMSDLGMNKVGSFGYKFTQSAIFTAYLQRRYQRSCDQVANFFDQCLQKKKSKKFQGPLLTKIQKIRYIVSRHPQPQKQKSFYSYQRFPSILQQLGSKQLMHEQIVLKLEEQELISQIQFLEFVEEERQLCQGFYEKTKPSQYNVQELVQLLNLLTNKNKQVLVQKNRQSESRNGKYYEVFKQVYTLQTKEISRMFSEWPKFTKNQIQIIYKDKLEYFNMKIQKKLSKQQHTHKIVSVWQGSNLQIIMKGNIKIIVTSNNQSITGTRVHLSNSSMASSRCKPVFYSIYLCIQSLRIRSFLNGIFKFQGQQIFDFIHNKVKNGSDNVWNIETLIQLRQYIQTVSQQSQFDSNKYLSNQDRKTSNQDKNTTTNEERFKSNEYQSLQQ